MRKKSLILFCSLFPEFSHITQYQWAMCKFYYPEEAVQNPNVHWSMLLLWDNAEVNGNL